MHGRAEPIVEFMTSMHITARVYDFLNCLTCQRRFMDVLKAGENSRMTDKGPVVWVLRVIDFPAYDDVAVMVSRCWLNGIQRTCVRGLVGRMASCAGGLTAMRSGGTTCSGAIWDLYSCVQVRSHLLGLESSDGCGIEASLRKL